MLKVQGTRIQELQNTRAKNVYMSAKVKKLNDFVSYRKFIRAISISLRS